MPRPSSPISYTWVDVDRLIARGDDPWKRVHVTPYMVHKSRIRNAGDIVPGASVTIAPGDFDSTEYVSLWLPSGYTWLKVPDKVKEQGYSTIGDLCAKLLAYSDKLFPKSRYERPADTPSGGLSTTYLLFHYWGNTSYRYQQSLQNGAGGRPKLDWSHITPDVETKVTGADGKLYELDWVLAKCSEVRQTCAAPGRQVVQEAKKLVDPPAPGEAGDWFLGSRTVWEGNAVDAYLDASSAWEAIGRAIEKAVNPEQNHFVYFVDWDFGLDTGMIGGKTIKTLLEQASNVRKIPVRTLLYQNQRRTYGMMSMNEGPDNEGNVKYVNSLDNGGAVHDGRYLYTGTHHQKMIVLNTSEGLVGFCGGIDIHPGRINWHDVHLRIRGPGASDLHRTFHERWQDHPWSAHAAHSSIIEPRAVTPVAAGDLTVQVLRTYGNGSKYEGINIPSDPNKVAIADNDRAPRAYNFAPGGERSILNFLVKAIGMAKKFIYIEDQYLVASAAMNAGPAISTVLADKLAQGLERLVILVARTESVNGELFQAWERRKRFIEPLLKAGPDKVFVCQYKIAAGSAVGTENPKYVHSKTWVFDDKMFYTGSANCNRRGYTHDSEVGAAVFDENRDGDRLYFAHRVRMRLWKKHLDPSNEARLTDEDLVDPIAASSYWKDPPATAPIERYEMEVGKSPASNKMSDSKLPKVNSLPLWDADTDWNKVLDPDGS